MMWIRTVWQDCWKIKYYSHVLQRYMSSNDDKSTSSFKIKVLYEYGYAGSEVRELLSKKIVHSVEHHRFKRTIEILHKLGFVLEDILENPKVFSLHPNSIDHRCKLLQEGGFLMEKITLDVIRQFPKFIKKNIVELKNMNLVDENIDVTKNILSYSDVPAYLFPSGANEAESFIQVQTRAIKFYLCWKLALKREEIDEKFKSYTALQCRSIRLISQSYDCLINEIGLSKEKINMNIYLLHNHPDNFRHLLKNVPVLGLSPIHSIAKVYPRILMMPTNKILENLHVLKEYNISAKSLSIDPRIMTLSPATVRSRLEYLYNKPHFRPYFNNPRICTLVTKFLKVINRYKLLNESRWRCHTLDILATSVKSFKGRFRAGADNSRGNDIVHYLHNELNMKHKEVREVISQHPQWKFASVATITETLIYLKEAGFYQSEIYNALPIVLYPRTEVEKFIGLIESQIELKCSQYQQIGQLHPELILHLVLYYIERPHHFTGNGIYAYHR